jgi:hypothetical protein
LKSYSQIGVGGGRIFGRLIDRPNTFWKVLYVYEYRHHLSSQTTRISVFPESSSLMPCIHLIPSELYYSGNNTINIFQRTEANNSNWSETRIVSRAGISAPAS